MRLCLRKLLPNRRIAFGSFLDKYERAQDNICMRPVTIDRLDIKIHERYAKDQEQLDTKYITESTAIASYSEIVGTSSIYPSNWQILFDLQIKNIPWALFSPPFRYTLQSNRFFSYQILPTIYLRDEDEEDLEDEEEEKKQKREKRRFEMIKKIMHTRKAAHQNLADFESERSTLLHLLDSIRSLDKLLGQINARKRQYQKG
jgi:hypothetical protein